MDAKVIRYSISNIIIVLSGALLVFSSKDGVDVRDIPTFLFIAALLAFTGVTLNCLPTSSSVRE